MSTLTTLRLKREPLSKGKGGAKKSVAAAPAPKRAASPSESAAAAEEEVQPTLHVAVGFHARGRLLERLTEAQVSVLAKILVREGELRATRSPRIPTPAPPRPPPHIALARSSSPRNPPETPSAARKHAFHHSTHSRAQDAYDVPDDFEVDKVRFGSLSGVTWEERIISAYYQRILPLKAGRASHGPWLCEECGRDGHRPRDCPAVFERRPRPHSEEEEEEE
jgi:hypothetical protein